MRPSTDMIELARQVRISTVQMVAEANASHVGSSLSIADILAVLYGGVLKIDPSRPDWPERDRFILSKGHAAAALYAVLAHRGFIPPSRLAEFCQDGSQLAGHATRAGVPGVEVSTGSLGHGLSIACGMALAGRTEDDQRHIYALLSDGELNEGSVWEAIMFAGHHRLGNLTAIVDFNRIQSFGRVADILDLEPLAEKWRGWGWHSQDVDGHDHEALRTALASPNSQGRDRDQPTVVIAHTTKGKGVSFMEDRLEWHYRSPKGDELTQALAELQAD